MIEEGRFIDISQQRFSAKKGRGVNSAVMVFGSTGFNVRDGWTFGIGRKTWCLGPSGYRLFHQQVAMSGFHPEHREDTLASTNWRSDDVRLMHYCLFEPHNEPRMHGP